MRKTVDLSHYGGVAQWLEQRTHNPLVAGSSPATPTKYYFLGDNTDSALAGFCLFLYIYQVYGQVCYNICCKCMQK